MCFPKTSSAQKTLEPQEEVTTPSYASEPPEAAISMDHPEAFDHFIERAFRHEHHWFDDASTDAESCLPVFGLVDPINRRETEGGRFLPVDFALKPTS